MTDETRPPVPLRPEPVRFTALHGGRADAPQARVPATFDIIDPRDWPAAAPERRWLVNEWIPIGTVTALYGDGGVGKSLLAQQLLTSVACALPWLGLPVTAGHAIGFMCEDDPDELHRRQASINAALGVANENLENLHYISRVGHENLLMTFDGEDAGTLTPVYHGLLALMDRMKPKATVLDTIADVYGGNENERPKVRQFVQHACAQLARAANGAVILLGHPSVTGMTSGTGTSGSTAWSNTVRSRLYLTRPKVEEGEDEPDPDLRVLRRMKANYAPGHDEIGLRWHEGVFSPTASGDRMRGAPISYDQIDQTFDEIDRAWKQKLPWSNSPQTRKAGRYLPRWMQQQFGISAARAETLVGDWIMNGLLAIEMFDNDAKAKGLRVVRRVR